MFFSQELASGVTRTQVPARIFGSAEFQQDLVKSDYLTVLHSVADPTGLALEPCNTEPPMSKSPPPSSARLNSL